MSTIPANISIALSTYYLYTFVLLCYIRLLFNFYLTFIYSERAQALHTPMFSQWRILRASQAPSEHPTCPGR